MRTARRPAAGAAVPYPMPCRRRALHAGQAAAEALIALAVLVLVVLAIAHAGRWHATALDAGLAARQAAFAWTRGDHGAGAPRDEAGVQLRMRPSFPLDDDAQPGGGHGHAAVLRKQWGMHDAAISAVQATVPGLRLPFATQRLSLRRHTAILAGAGHAADDADVQGRVAQSALAWGNAAGSSVRAGRSVALRMAAVDRAWGRPEPRFDWLQTWAGAVPPERVRGSADAAGIGGRARQAQ